MFQLNEVAPARLRCSVISMTWPFLFPARGLAASGPGLPAVTPRWVLLVQAT